MPELPEVENVRLSLLPLIQGKTITAIGTNWEKILTGGLAHFQQTLVGHTVTGLDRRGKYLLFRFDHGVTMVSHLRMEGKYQVVPYPTVPFGRFAHVWFTFSDDSQLRYHDMRKFGRMQLIATGQEHTVSGLASLGPEPTPAQFDLAAFAAKLKARKAPIKSVLLDQTVVAGVGNIYADETLWQARVNPQQPACTLKKTEIAALHDAIIAVLAQSIQLGGTSVHTFVDATGARGGFQDRLHVYERQGEPCDRCGTAIVKIKVGQRGTHYCPKCQPLRKRVIR
ncbi:bifunctional DNA-formamidopyrimidine glycosylase/DNA-(apurinic or apyrimidinic site) lyase [Lacticaseibacillus nasuensis]|uniref:bifunctional DNA-formamidopyrimidine glycosylase/DNA-(apurinic or apyrimidinic site) lyase n=1 Tax=Lacticaseibacillus nasuensis TaxID=944671 RepID=UPI002247550B|nr:bifunctional DNA-formamidopyrimidine glycosylase/DNA-(apurinic or apyrimidinic site) lyase [Lacticaseibacillus nasuensis]MCX2455012.1 bifunctional DNA-formamidopyrimidine glycosylase/DNA-(apurinic or apyrimidinic site) lyase [Lacticaseibacillus nasuensis]